MIIDVAQRIAEVKAITAQWALDNGYVPPAEEPEIELSEMGRNLKRILDASDFGCQQRNVAAILSVISGDKIKVDNSHEARAEYLGSPTGFPFNLALVPIANAPYGDAMRTGVVFRTSSSQNAGLRQSNGQMAQQHYRRESVRPATEQEIEQYFREFFGLEQNPRDVEQSEMETPF